MITVAIAAAAIANDAGVPELTDYVARQLRTFIQRGLVTPDHRAGRGATAAAVLAPQEVCRARLLFGLATALTLDVTTLAAINRWITADELARVCGEARDENAPVSEFSVAIRRQRKTGELNYFGGFLEAGTQFPQYDRRSGSDFADGDGGKFEARLTMPATRIFYDVLNYLDDRDA